MKGIILAGGAGTRLYPASLSISKILLPIYDKPMIYYPICTLMLAGIKDIMIITNSRDKNNFIDVLGDGSQFGLNFQYAIQHEPRGIVDAFLIAEDFINGDSSCLVLGDNIFHGMHFIHLLKRAASRITGATIFGYNVSDPQRFGVVEFDQNYKVISIEEKPQNPKSNYAVPGLYFYTNDVIEIAKNVQPSARGELEITSVNEEYMKRNQLYVETFGRGMTWFDTGTHDALLETASFVQTIEKRQGMQVCCPEEIAFQNKWITAEQLSNLADQYMKTDYGKYLKALSEGK